jgi:hypothetical protein|tara:strand:+ start:5071 stop:5613 length:543 start_codon:yes stop_codon:yes gene_type:complete
MSGPLTINIKINLPDITSIKASMKNRYNDLLNEEGNRILKEVKEGWDGWKYSPWRGFSRPGALRGVSQAAWQMIKEDGTGDNKNFIVLRNFAVDWRADYYSQQGKPELSAKYKNRPYVSLVTRSGQSKPEYKKVIDVIESEHLPRLKQKFVESFADAFADTPKVNRTPKPSATSGMTIIS